MLLHFFVSVCLIVIYLIPLIEQTSAVSAKYLMKTDDDAFVRVDAIHSSVQQLNVSKGLLYGRINADSAPHRNRESKWYISSEVMPP